MVTVQGMVTSAVRAWPFSAVSHVRMSLAPMDARAIGLPVSAAARRAKPTQKARFRYSRPVSSSFAWLTLRSVGSLMWCSICLSVSICCSSMLRSSGLGDGGYHGGALERVLKFTCWCCEGRVTGGLFGIPRRCVFDEVVLVLNVRGRW